jgi:uncharacterized protein YegP (UPF0339 family)
MKKYMMFRDAKSEWRWSLRAENGKIVATSGEGYEHRSDCLHAIGLVMDSANAPVFDETGSDELPCGEPPPTDDIPF